MSNLKSSILINGLFRHPSDETSVSKASRPLRGIPSHRGKFFIHRRSWTELKTLPFYTHEEFVQRFGLDPAIENLFDYFRNPEKIPGYDLVGKLAHKFGYDFYPSDLDRRQIHFARRKLHYFPLESKDQMEVGIEAVIVRFGRLDDQGPEWTNFFLIHYLEDVWSNEGTQPAAYEFFDDAETQISYGTRASIVRPDSEGDGFEWDVIEYHEDSERRWRLGTCVDSGSVGTLISMREARRSRGDAETRIRREIGMLIEPSRAKHRDIKERIDFPTSDPVAAPEKPAQTREQPTALDLVRRKEGTYVPAGVEFVDGKAVNMIWVTGYDGVRERVNVPKSRKNIPLTMSEKTLKARYGLSDSNILDIRADPSHLDFLMKKFRESEEKRFAEQRESVVPEAPKDLGGFTGQRIKPVHGISEDEYPSTEIE